MEVRPQHSDTDEILGPSQHPFFFLLFVASARVRLTFD